MLPLPVVADAAATARKPPWLKVRAPSGERYARLKELFRRLDLHTVCEEAHCPNMGECWGGGTATLMLLGDTCTRGCRFCNVRTGNPHGAVDEREPEKVAEAVAATGLDYVVLTMVDRDDLQDGGADHVARTVEELKARSKGRLLVEVLVGDFQGDLAAIERVARAGADVLAHNVETVRRLTPRVRDRRSTYDRSLDVLAALERLAPPGTVTKSSIMLGLGETEDEVVDAARDLRARSVEILTLGQYLTPSSWHLPVEAYVPPERFDALRERTLALGFAFVAAGPLVRSSYRAGELFLESYLAQRRRRTDDPNG